jgi:hypothetical protein
LQHQSLFREGKRQPAYSRRIQEHQCKQKFPWNRYSSQFRYEQSF